MIPSLLRRFHLAAIAGGLWLLLLAFAWQRSNEAGVHRAEQRFESVCRRSEKSVQTALTVAQLRLNDADPFIPQLLLTEETQSNYFSSVLAPTLRRATQSNAPALSELSGLPPPYVYRRVYWLVSPQSQAGRYPAVALTFLELFGEVVRELPPGIDLYIFKEGGSQAYLSTSSVGATQPKQAPLRKDKMITWGGLPLVLQWTGSEQFLSAAATNEPWVILFFGLGLGLLLVLLIASLTETRFQALKLARNMTRELREQEKDLKEFERYFSLANDLFGVLSKEGLLRTLNPAFEHAVGYTKQELTAGSLSHFLIPESRAVLQELITNMATRPVASNLRLDMRHKNGHTVALRWSANTVHSQKWGAVIYLSGHEAAEQSLPLPNPGILNQHYEMQKYVGVFSAANTEPGPAATDGNSVSGLLREAVNHYREGFASMGVPLKWQIESPRTYSGSRAAMLELIEGALERALLEAATTAHSVEIVAGGDDCSGIEIRLGGELFEKLELGASPQ